MTAVLQPDVLDRSRATVLPALRAAVGRLDPASRAATAYHLGWTGADGRPRDLDGGGGGGKAVRSTLAMLSGELAGAPAEVGVPGAVAVELVHNYSLLHDDVMDGDTERRHRPTVWALWGVSTAVLTGDALLGLAAEVLLESRSPQAAGATRELLSTSRELVRGQFADLAFETRPTVGLGECLEMAAAKTGALLALSSCIGARLAGAPEPVVDALRSYGAHLGTAFQLVDDLLGIWGDPTVTGKPVLADLRTRKKSLPVTYVLSSGTPAGRALAAWYAADRAPDRDSDDVLARIAELVEDGGGRSWAEAEAARRMRRAEAALARVALPVGPRDQLLELGHFLTARQY